MYCVILGMLLAVCEVLFEVKLSKLKSSFAFSEFEYSLSDSSESSNPSFNSGILAEVWELLRLDWIGFDCLASVAAFRLGLWKQGGNQNWMC